MFYSSTPKTTKALLFSQLVSEGSCRYNYGWWFVCQHDTKKTSSLSDFFLLFFFSVFPFSLGFLDRCKQAVPSSSSRPLVCFFLSFFAPHSSSSFFLSLRTLIPGRLSLFVLQLPFIQPLVISTSFFFWRAPFSRNSSSDRRTKNINPEQKIPAFYRNGLYLAHANFRA